MGDKEPKKSEDEKPAEAPAEHHESKTEPTTPPQTEDSDNLPDKQPKPMGRPLKFQSVKELQSRIDEYFGNCDPHLEDEVLELTERANGEQYARYRKRITQQKPYLIHGLARHLDTTRDVLIDYESGKHDNKAFDAELNADFSNTITRAKAKIAEFAESQLYVSGASHGAQFSLKNNYGWKDESKLITENVSDDLDDLDRQSGSELAAANRKKLSDEAAQQLGDQHGERSTPTEPVVATDAPVQNPQ